MTLKMTIAAAVSTLLTLPQPKPLPVDFGQTGTLVTVVPSRDGLIVSADTRHMMFGVSCDYGSKLHRPENLPATVFTFTGTPEFLAVRQPFGPDPCKDMQEGIPLLSMSKIVRRFLVEQNKPVSEIDLQELARLCQQGVTEYFSNSPQDRSVYVQRRELVTVILASYEPTKSAGFVRAIKVWLPSESELKTDLEMDRKYSNDDPPDWLAFGQGQFLVEHVLNGVGRQFLDEPTYKHFGSLKSVGDVAPDFASSLSHTFIDATSRTSQIVPITTGVGGKIHTLHLNATGALQLR